MRMYVQGKEANQLVEFAGEDTEVLNIFVANDDGSPFDLTGVTVELLAYQRSDRSDTPGASIARAISATATAAAVGQLAATKIPSTDMAQFALKKGLNYLFLHATKSGTDVISRAPLVFNIN